MFEMRLYKPEMLALDRSVFKHEHSRLCEEPQPYVGARGHLVDKIRVSSGSAITLGLITGLLAAKPTTAYLLTYVEGKCMANCSFCSQSKTSRSGAEMLSRVSWPVFATRNVISRLAIANENATIRRVCIQTLNYAKAVANLLALVEEIKKQAAGLPISISCHPTSREDMVKLARAGVDRIGIALDAATREIFERVKGNLAGGPYDWDRQHEMLLHAVDVFGRWRVTTHLIVGLGETERDMIETIQWCTDNNIYPALFSFTPICGTALEQNHPPSIDHYRRVQLARQLIVSNRSKFKRMRFDRKSKIVDFGVSKKLLIDAVQSGSPFKTSGCPDCNRPYYNEKPSGPLYNFPTHPTSKQIKQIEKRIFCLAKNTHDL